MDYRRQHSSKRSHRHRAEGALGKPLPFGVVVHHASGGYGDGQLVICQDQAYHMLLHQRTRIVQAGGNPDTERFCSCCRKCKLLAAFKRRPGGYETQCRDCRQVLSSHVYKKRKYDPRPAFAEVTR